MSCTAVQTYYTGDGVQTLFTFPFEYLNESDVKVGIYDDTTELYVDKAQDDATYGWSFVNATTIEFVTAPLADLDAPDGNNIRIYRDTGVDSLEATFYPGSSIRAQDLNDNFEQLRMAMEEGQCYLSGDVQTELDDRYWSKIEAYTSVDQLAQNPVSDDTVITSQAAADRHDTILSDVTSTPVQPGKLWANTSNNTFNWWDGPNSTWVNSGQAGPKGDKGEKGDPGEPGTGGAVYKGQTDFTQPEPVNPANGDFWLNTVDGIGNWTGFATVPVTINDRAIYNSTTLQWDLIPVSDKDSSWTVINTVTQPSNVNVDTVREENFSVGTATLSSTINANGVTANRAVSLPDKNGTIALTSDISNAKITLTAGTNLTGGGDFTLNQTDDLEITFDGSGLSIKGGGTEVVASATALNFTGASVTVTDSGNGEAEIAISGGGGDADLTVVKNPEITGSMLVGQTIGIANPTITGGSPGLGGDFVDGYKRTYQWERAATADGPYSDIAGATNQTYTLSVDDTLQFIRCAVTNTDNAVDPASVVARNIPAQVFRGTQLFFARNDATPTTQVWSGTPWNTTISGTSPTNPAPDPRAAYIGIQARMFVCLVTDDGTRTYTDQLNCRKAQVGNWLRLGKTTFWDINQPWAPLHTSPAGTYNYNQVDNTWFDNNLPAWTTGTVYAVGDQVKHNGDYWYCSVAHTSSNSGQTAPPRSATGSDPDAAVDGSEGQVMIEIPKFSCEKTWTDDQITFTLYDDINTVGNAKVHPLFVRADDTVRDFAYVGKFFNSTAVNASNVMTSVAANAVSMGVIDPRQIPRSMANNRGINWEPKSFHTEDALCWLHMHEYGTLSAYVWGANPYGTNPNATTLSKDPVYSNQTYAAFDYSVGTERYTTYRGLPTKSSNGCINSYVDGNVGEYYVNTTSVNRGNSNDTVDKSKFDFSTWAAGQNTTFGVADIATGVLGEDVTTFIPTRTATSPDLSVYTHQHGGASLQRSGIGWTAIGTYSDFGSIYLTQNTHSVYHQLCYYP